MDRKGQVKTKILWNENGELHSARVIPDGETDLFLRFICEDGRRLFLQKGYVIKIEEVPL